MKCRYCGDKRKAPLIWPELMERQGKEPGTESTEDGRGDKNNTPSNTYKPQWAEKFHFKGDFHRYGDS